MKRTLKRTFTALMLLFIFFSAFVLITNRNSQMTLRQKFLKTIYPVFMWWSNKSISEHSILSNDEATAAVSFYSLADTTISGAPFNFNDLKGKKVLLVNTASNCGFTPQYDELEKLYGQNKGKLVILGFPANDFKQQEQGSDKEIAEFCKINFGVSFPLMKKSSVKKGNSQNEVFKWLSDPHKNGWNKQQPIWNFSKYLVDENGKLINYFGPAISPLSKEVIAAINK